MSNVLAETTPPGSRVERRRARARQRILGAAEAMMSERGVDEVTIADITDAADLARRTFYHHFTSKHDVLVPIARARTQALNRRVDRQLEGLRDPAEIVVRGIRYTLRALPQDPLCSWFVLRSGLPFDRLRDGIGESGARDIQRGIEAGRFVVSHPAVVEALILGSLIGAISARLEGRLADADLDVAAAHMLQLLGIPAAEAHELAHRPLAPLPPNDSKEELR